MNSTPPSPLEALRRLVTALQRPSCFDHPVRDFETVETHISIVLLTGDFAYKFKKPVDLGFVDFTSLKRRRYFCEEELRLNRRLAPELYLDVIAVGGDAAAPRPGATPVLEYCVKMRQFPRRAELTQALARGEVGRAAFGQLAQTVAGFHERAGAAAADSGHGTFATVQRQCLQNFEVLGEERSDPGLTVRIRTLEEWTGRELQRLRERIELRRQHGRVRECHGDMHITNMIWLDGAIRVFDCIEFNPELRWIDVMSEIAFLLMDLDLRDHGDYARVFLNAYLEAGGDYDGLALLPLFKAYRSLVRAKIALLQLRGNHADPDLHKRMRAHVQLAARYTRASVRPVLIITRGLSGSGKTTITDALIPLCDAVRVRSDVERKRMAGLDAAARSHSGLGEALYADDHTRRTYSRLAGCARAILAAGRAAIVDATFLRRDQRQLFQALASELGVPFRILDCRAPEAALRERITQRARQGRDASEADLAVLERQLSTIEPLTAEERAAVLALDTTGRRDPMAIKRALGL